MGVMDFVLACFTYQMNVHSLAGEIITDHTSSHYSHDYISHIEKVKLDL
jgi:hypothetical protein